MKLLVSELFLKAGDFVVEVLVHSLLDFGERQTKRFNTTVAFCGFIRRL